MRQKKAAGYTNSQGWRTLQREKSEQQCQWQSLLLPTLCCLPIRDGANEESIFQPGRLSTQEWAQAACPPAISSLESHGCSAESTCVRPKGWAFDWGTFRCPRRTSSFHADEQRVSSENEGSRFSFIDLNPQSLEGVCLFEFVSDFSVSNDAFWYSQKSASLCCWKLWELRKFARYFRIFSS